MINESIFIDKLRDLVILFKKKGIEKREYLWQRINL